MRKNAKHFQNTDRVVQARRFELVDRHGRVRGDWGVIGDRLSLTVYDMVGEVRYFVHVHTDKTEISCWDSSGKIWALPPTRTKDQLSIADRNGSSRPDRSAEDDW